MKILFTLYFEKTTVEVIVMGTNLKTLPDVVLTIFFCSSWTNFGAWEGYP